MAPTGCGPSSAKSAHCATGGRPTFASVPAPNGPGPRPMCAVSSHLPRKVHSVPERIDLPSLDVVAGQVAAERETMNSHAESLDSKAGVVLGFAGVLVGLGALLALFTWTALDYFSPRRRLAVSAGVLYWHFVDGVWVVVFSVVYLWDVVA